MAKIPRVFFVPLILVSALKKCECACEKINKNAVVCESVPYISDTVISSIPNINQVTRIEISHSPELEIYSKAFKSVIFLKHIHIHHNKIHKIYHDSFRGTRAKFFYLDNNDITSLPSGTFANLSSLIELKINNNYIREIPLGLFSNIPVKVLVLSNNSIQTLEDGALQNLPKLTHLKLNGNKLETVFMHQILTYPERLGFLLLHNNSLTAITNHMLLKLENLILLNVGYNSIAFIEPESFENTPRLKILTLSNNHLKQLSDNVFPRSGMDYLNVLQLDNNKFMFLPSRFFARLVRLKQATIFGNPWICPCLTEIEKVLEQKNVSETCAEDYHNGRRPSCLDENPSSRCRYVYNNDLSEKYEAYKMRDPLQKPPLFCVTLI